MELLVTAAPRHSAMTLTAFIVLDATTTPYDTHCLWTTSRDNAVLATFVAAVWDKNRLEILAQ
ncbi:type 2 periplasmic-binding domain-containing protein [Polaromonas glacialis]|uniref:hypothetical protein n=1 Tax=Polaromonas glacialis TaxID=866564 RepID=UPI0004972B16|nr:hypothetical protein [Polaromonas glacialis]